MDPITMSPGGWIKFLEPLLDAQVQRVKVYRSYYDGTHRLAYATQRFRETFSRWFPPLADNWMKLIVDTPVERLHIVGFRIGEQGGLNKEARSLWKRLKLNKVARQLHTEMGKCGKAYLLVDPTGDVPRITAESPLEVYVHVDPGSGERLAAIKRWVGDDEYWRMVLYLPDRVYWLKSANKAGRGHGTRPQWRAIETAIPNELDVVPMIPVENNSDMMIGGVSDLDEVMPIQDRINKLCLDMDVSSEYYAAPQRYATGWEPPSDPVTKQPLPQVQIESVQSRFLAFHSEDTEVGQLPAGDPKAFIEPIDMYVRHMAAVSRTPPHYLLGEMVNVSGDALASAETGLTAKSEGKIDDASPSWEEAMALALKKKPEETTALWRDVEHRTFGQLVDGAAKLNELGLPLEMCWEMIGMDQDQIDRAKALMPAELERKQKLAAVVAPQNGNGNDSQGDPEGDDNGAGAKPNPND